MPILRIRDQLGKFVSVPSIVGPQGPQGPQGSAGKSAYQTAVDAGYTGTEGAFNSALKDAPEHVARTDNPHGVTAAQAGAAPSGFGLGTAAKLVTGSSIEDICAMGSGFYRGQTVTNAPDTGWWYFIVLKDSTSYQNVIALDYGNGPIYRGSVSNGTWSGWAKLVTEDLSVMKLISGGSETRVTSTNATSVSYTGINCAVDDDNRATVQITRPKDGSNPSIQLYNCVGGTSTKIGDLIHTGNLSGLGITRIAAGMYTGTGVYGSSNKNTLTFDFEPKLMIICEELSMLMCSSTDGWEESGIWAKGIVGMKVKYGNASATSFVSVSGNTISWYTNGSSAGTQLNASGATYNYIVAG